MTWFCSVVALEHRQLKIGEIAEMRLMKRDRHSLSPRPVTYDTSVSINKHVQQQAAYLTTAGENHVYSKLLLATPRDVVELILRPEQKDLECQWEQEKECPESCFIEQALQLLAWRMSATMTSDRPLPSPIMPGTDATKAADIVDAMGDLELTSARGRCRLVSSSSEGFADHLSDLGTSSPVPSPPVRCLCKTRRLLALLYYTKY